MLHVPYHGTEELLIDLMTGRIDMVVGTIAPHSRQVRAGKVLAFAVMSDKRSPVLPDVPTIEEAGVPDCDAALWTWRWWRRSVFRRTLSAVSITPLLPPSTARKCKMR